MKWGISIPKKKCGLEIAERLGSEVPDWVAVSVVDGCTIAGTWKGLQEMRALGFIRRLPRVLGVQAEGARPLVDAFELGRDLQPVPAHTLADSICGGHPRNWRKALRAVRESKGGIVSRRDTALAVVTGSRLKDVKSAIRAAGEPVTLPPDDTELAAYLRERPP